MSPETHTTTLITSGPARIADIICKSAGLLATCDRVVIRGDGTITARKGDRTTIVSADSRGQAVFCFSEDAASGKQTYQRELDCDSVAAAVAVMTDWLTAE